MRWLDLSEITVSLERPLTTIGITFILIGIALILVPIIIKFIPTVDGERIPWILLYIYKKDNFIFATSPILIIIGAAYFLLSLLHR